MNVKTHPLGDKLASMLLGIESVPPKEQRRMCNAVVKEAMKWHDGVNDDNAKMIAALKEICRNDKTYYEYGEARGSDGQRPDMAARWAAPREIAREVLNEMGIYDI